MSNANKSSWTPERVELLVRLWNSGMSASKVAEQLGGVSRNAVIGKVYRLKGNDGRKRKTDKSVGVSGAVDVTATSLRRGRSAKPAVAANDAAPVVAQTGVKFLDLDVHSCRWPIGDPTRPDFHFCGQRRVAHASYCQKHMEEAYQLEGRRKTS